MSITDIWWDNSHSWNDDIDEYSLQESCTGKGGQKQWGVNDVYKTRNQT